LGERIGQSLKNNIFERMKAAYQKSDLGEQLKKHQTSNEDTLHVDKLFISLLNANTSVGVQKNDLKEFVESVAKEDPQTQQKVVSVGEVLQSLGIKQL